MIYVSQVYEKRSVWHHTDASHPLLGHVLSLQVSRCAHTCVWRPKPRIEMHFSSTDSIIVCVCVCVCVCGCVLRERERCLCVYVCEREWECVLCVCCERECVCARVCVCAHIFVTNEDINVYNNTYDRYYKEKVTYEDISPCPHFLKHL